ncbi:MAG TPA: heparin lyase I family protein [Pirellulales bacterium]|nr:heparin lyase I family protein [Pirellulales bacterium]
MKTRSVVLLAAVLISSAALAAELDPFPASGTYKTDQLGAITVWGLKASPQSAEKPYSIGVHGDVLRIEARQGDRRQKASEINRPIERCELSFNANPLEFGRTYDITFDVLFEPGPPSTAKNDKFFQVHNVNDEGDAILGPVFAVQLEREHMRIVVRWDENRITTSRVEDHWVFEDTKDIERGRWYAFDMRVRFDPSGNGMARVRRDGVELANYQGPLGYNDAKPPYAKLGIYRDTRPEPQARRYRALSIKQVDER